MIRDNPNTVDGVEFWIEFDDTVAVGEDAKVRVFSKNATGRKVWLKVYDHSDPPKRIAEFPLRKGIEPDPPTVWTEELDFAVPNIPLYIDREGPLSRYLARRQHTMTKEELEIVVGRHLHPDRIGYPAHGVSLFVQVWR